MFLPQSVSYQERMRRFVTLIVLLFTFASVMGGTVAHAHRYISTPIVVLNHVDADNQSIPVVVMIQRGDVDLGAGIVMPCGFHPGIAVSDGAAIASPDCAGHEAAALPALARWQAKQNLRPPISA